MPNFSVLQEKEVVGDIARGSDSAILVRVAEQLAASAGVKAVTDFHYDLAARLILAAQQKALRKSPALGIALQLPRKSIDAQAIEEHEAVIAELETIVLKPPKKGQTEAEFAEQFQAFLGDPPDLRDLFVASRLAEMVGIKPMDDPQEGVRENLKQVAVLFDRLKEYLGALRNFQKAQDQMDAMEAARDEAGKKAVELQRELVRCQSNLIAEEAKIPRNEDEIKFLTNQRDAAQESVTQAQKEEQEAKNEGDAARTKRDTARAQIRGKQEPVRVIKRHFKIQANQEWIKDYVKVESLLSIVLDDAKLDNLLGSVGSDHVQAGDPAEREKEIQNIERTLLAAEREVQYLKEEDRLLQQEFQSAYRQHLARMVNIVCANNMEPGVRVKDYVTKMRKVVRALGQEPRMPAVLKRFEEIAGITNDRPYPDGTYPLDGAGIAFRPSTRWYFLQVGWEAERGGFREDPCYQVSIPMICEAYEVARQEIDPHDTLKLPREPVTHGFFDKWDKLPYATRFSLMREMWVREMFPGCERFKDLDADEAAKVDFYVQACLGSFQSAVRRGHSPAEMWGKAFFIPRNLAPVGNLAPVENFYNLAGETDSTTGLPVVAIGQGSFLESIQSMTTEHRKALKAGTKDYATPHAAREACAQAFIKNFPKDSTQTAKRFFFNVWDTLHAQHPALQGSEHGPALQRATLMFLASMPKTFPHAYFSEKAEYKGREFEDPEVQRAFAQAPFPPEYRCRLMSAVEQERLFATIFPPMREIRRAKEEGGLDKAVTYEQTPFMTPADASAAILQAVKDRFAVLNLGSEQDAEALVKKYCSALTVLEHSVLFGGAAAADLSLDFYRNVAATMIKNLGSMPADQASLTAYGKKLEKAAAELAKVPNESKEEEPTTATEEGIGLSGLPVSLFFDPEGMPRAGQSFWRFSFNWWGVIPVGKKEAAVQSPLREALRTTHASCIPQEYKVVNVSAFRGFAGGIRDIPGSVYRCAVQGKDGVRVGLHFQWTGKDGRISLAGSGVKDSPFEHAAILALVRLTLHNVRAGAGIRMTGRAAKEKLVFKACAKALLSQRPDVSIVCGTIKGAKETEAEEKNRLEQETWLREVQEELAGERAKNLTPDHERALESDPALELPREPREPRNLPVPVPAPAPAHLVPQPPRGVSLFDLARRSSSCSSYDSDFQESRRRSFALPSPVPLGSMRRSEDVPLQDLSSESGADLP